MEILRTIEGVSWQENLSSARQLEITQTLEEGSVLFFPALAFQLKEEEQPLLSPHFASLRSKNISFNKITNELRGVAKNTSSEAIRQFQILLTRFADQSERFVNQLFPRYQPFLKIGRSSFRPVEVKGRVSSYRKDDSRLHVDAFPANPNQGWRILRVFCNVNPQKEARVWRLGEPFEEVVSQFLPKLKKPFPGSAAFLNLLKITKSYRTLYDHYMLQLHDNMKADEIYQRKAIQQTVHFPPQSTWVVQTDHVSHAALSGQYLLEQTFYLPTHAMLNENKSPLRVLEKFLNKELVKK